VKAAYGRVRDDKLIRQAQVKFDLYTSKYNFEYGISYKYKTIFPGTAEA